MLKDILNTSNELPPLILRATVGAVVLAHGMQKLLGWFGGHGAMATMEAFNAWWGFPYLLTFLVIMSDFFGALLLLTGLATRIAAGSIGIVMLGAIHFAHGQWGFYMNWYSEPRGEGFEFHILVLGMVVALMFTGGGRWSVDRFLMKRFGATKAE